MSLRRTMRLRRPMPRALGLVLALAAAQASAPAAAQAQAAYPAAAQAQLEDADLLLGLPDPAPPPPVTTAPRLFQWSLQTSHTAQDRRIPLPAPPTAASAATTQLRLQGLGDLDLAAATRLHLNLAASLTHARGDSWGIGTLARLDLREAYLSHHRGDWRLDLGRINLRQGVGVGFSPSDFFRAEDSSARPDLDPAEARLNRLGVVALRAERLWARGAASLTVAPALTGGPGWMQDAKGIGLGLGASNPRQRALVSFTQDWAEGLAPQLSILAEEGGVKTAVSVSASLGESWLFWVDWAGGRGFDLRDAALEPARAAGGLAPALAAALGARGQDRWLSRAALGAQWASPGNLSATVEYHYNGAGFSRADWAGHFALAEAVAGDAAASAQLALIGRTAALQLEPMSRQALFVRLVQEEARPGLRLGAVLATSLEDGSGALQLEARQDLSGASRLSLRAGHNFGARQSDYGSRSSRAYLSLGLETRF